VGTVDLDGSIPAWLTGFIDDTAVFPPSSVALDRAVAEHRAHRRSAYAGLLGGFVVSDLKVPDLIDVLDGGNGDDEEEPLEINLLVTGGAGAIAPAVRWASRAPHLRLRAIELTLRDEDDLAHNARRALTALDAVEEDLSEVEVYVELPRSVDGPTHRWLAALDELGAAELRAKFRTGGVTPDAIPAVAELVSWIDAALDRELPFRCTGGLVNAVSGPASYGFLNVLVATRACLDGADAAVVLTETSAETLLGGTDAEELARTRRWFTGFGSGDLLESHDDLVELGLVTPA
jgi:hypothetical protein